MREAVLFTIAVLIAGPSLAASAARPPSPAVPGYTTTMTGAPAASSTVLQPNPSALMASATALVESVLDLTSGGKEEGVKKHKKDKKGKKKHDRKNKNQAIDLDYSFVFLPVQRRYVVEDLSTGKFSTAHQDYSKKAGNSFFLSFGKKERMHRKSFYTRGYLGFGYSEGVYSMAGTEMVSNPDAVSDKGLRREGDRIDDDVASIVLAVGSGIGYERKHLDAFLGWRAGLLPTAITTRTTDAYWPADGSGAVKLVNHETRHVLLADFGLVLDIGLIRLGDYHLGLNGRFGYVGRTKLGTDPNDLIGLVGKPPDGLGTQFAMGGTYWSAGLKIF